MAALTITTRQSNPYAPTINTLTASDTLVYSSSKKMEMHLRNTTGSPITATIDGSGASAALAVPGAGGLTVDLSAGKALQVSANGCLVVPLDSLKEYLKGNIVITGGTGLTAVILSN